MILFGYGVVLQCKQSIVRQDGQRYESLAGNIRESSSNSDPWGGPVRKPCEPDVAQLQGDDAAAHRRRAQTAVGQLLDQLERQNAGEERFKDAWCRTLKEIVELGPDAVPELIAELDATDNDMMLRCLGFTLRAIGDRRAVPALIRSIPRTLRPPGSDMGLRAKDPELAAFAQRHDLGDSANDYYSFGRPVREIMGALHQLTNHDFADDELFHIFLDGLPTQRRMRQKLFYRTAEEWAGWWEVNWEQFVKDEAYAQVELGAMKLEASQPLPPTTRFKTTGGGSNWVLESVWHPVAHVCFYDLDTGRAGRLPERWHNAQPIAPHLDDIAAWAADEGFDLMGTDYVAADGEHVRAVQTLELDTWELGPERWKTEVKGITLKSLQQEGRHTEGLLLHYDRERKQIDAEGIASFLFVTREGTPGLLFIGIEVKDDSLQPGGVYDGDNELNPVAFRKGRRFGFKFFEVAP